MGIARCPRCRPRNVLRIVALAHLIGQERNVLIAAIHDATLERKRQLLDCRRIDMLALHQRKAQLGHLIHVASAVAPAKRRNLTGAGAGIALSVVGVGLGNTRDDLMQTLALNGNGNYSYIDTQLEAEKVFTEELSGTLYTVANDAKAGVTFNADAVSSYRLLGYDMKHISEDDFNNPEKDAGEIGSNLCVTVMYEIEPNDAAEGGALAEIAVRYRDAEGQDCEAALTVSGEEPATDDTRFAACVAEFALVLRQSQYRGTASLGNVLTRLADLNGYLAGDAYKEEFGELVSLAAESGLYEGEAEDPA